MLSHVKARGERKVVIRDKKWQGDDGKVKGHQNTER